MLLQTSFGFGFGFVVEIVEEIRLLVNNVIKRCINGTVIIYLTS